MNQTLPVTVARAQAEGDRKLPLVKAVCARACLGCNLALACTWLRLAELSLVQVG